MQAVEVESLSSRLRIATRAEHEATEAALALVRDDVTLADYAAYLARMYDAHRWLEATLAGLPEMARVVPDLASRKRAALLADDLRVLGVSRTTPVVAGNFSVPEALGALYVLEGATLGGQVLRRELNARLGAAIASSQRYLAGYDNVGAMWKTFRETLDAYGAARPADADAVVHGALAMFGRVRGAEGPAHA